MHLLIEARGSVASINPTPPSSSFSFNLSWGICSTVVARWTAGQTAIYPAPGAWFITKFMFISLTNLSQIHNIQYNSHTITHLNQASIFSSTSTPPIGQSLTLPPHAKYSRLPLPLAWKKPGWCIFCYILNKWPPLMGPAHDTEQYSGSKRPSLDRSITGRMGGR